MWYIIFGLIILVGLDELLVDKINTFLQWLMVLGALAWWTIATFTDWLKDSNPDDKADTNDNINRKFTDIM